MRKRQRVTMWFEMADENFGQYLGSFSYLLRKLSDRDWWKAVALIELLDERPDIRSVAWCDDHLNRYARRRDMVRTHCTAHGIRLMTLCPDRGDGLTLYNIAAVEVFLTSKTERPHG